MFSSIINAFSVLANLSKIKAAAQASYEVVVKLIVVLKVVDQQIAGTPIAKEIDKYLPTAIKSLDTIKSLAEKFAPILGITIAPSTVASVATNAQTALSNASAALALHV
jgi:hypothetical protein